MHACRICLRNFNKLRFHSSRISICGRCVNTLNESHEVAEAAEKRVGEMLLRGMERNALRDLEFGEPWQKAKAQRTLSNIGGAHADALPRWLNKLLANPENTSKDFKLLRAHRRGLLHYDRPTGWGYPNNWKEVASRIRRLDGFRCVACAALDQAIDVHHIVYVSNFGTHQQSNLISLCRDCHEAEHKKSFDIGEAETEQDESPGETTKEVVTATRPVNEPLLEEPVLQGPPPPQRQAHAERQPPSAPRTLPQQNQHVPSPTTSLNQVTANAAGSRDAQRFCGYCRTLLVPRRRYLVLKQCPSCKHLI